ncbi:MAG: hypothetical protein WA063_02455 [Minisyncoccia bacterium]
MEIFKNLRKNKGSRLSNEKIKNILQTSRISLEQIIDKTGDRNAQEEIGNICKDFYDANESISSNEDAKIEEPIMQKLILATEKIEEIDKKEILSPALKPVVRTIATQTLEIRDCFLSQKAPA